jgi:protein-S-isoprenylcysteine O-methyltransferase Ste14
MSIAVAEPNRPRYALDGAERVLVVLLYVFLLYRFASAVAEQPINALYLVTEGIVMAMVLLRRSTDQISISPRDWAVAFGGTFLSMALAPGHPIAGLSTVAGVAMAIGFAVSLAAKLQLRRSFGLVAANRGLKTTGIYALVRHPMYLGYFFVQAGMLMLNFNPWNIAILFGWAMLQLMRIEAEERVLLLDPAYRAHAEQVRFRLVPSLY